MKVDRIHFDAKKVLFATDRVKREALKGSGRFLRKVARSSIKKKRRSKKKEQVSQPGDPPFGKSGRLKSSILFGYDRQSDSVVIGPKGVQTDTPPRALEYGGRSKTTVKVRKKKTASGGSARRKTSSTGAKRKKTTQRVRRIVTIKARPFMRPALGKTIPKLDSIWANSMRKG